MQPAVGGSCNNVISTGGVELKGTVEQCRVLCLAAVSGRARAQSQLWTTISSSAVRHDLMSRSAVPAHRTHNNSWLPTPALIILRIVFMLAQLLFSIMFCPDAHPQLSPLYCRPARYSDLFEGRSILYFCKVWLRSVQCIVVLWTVRNVESACERQPSPSCSSVTRLSIDLPRNIKATLP